jgi:hypothetical protein
MAEIKPKFALDLSNDGISLWHRNGGPGWVSLGRVSLNDPNLKPRIAQMRKQAGVAARTNVPVQVRIPRSEILVTKVKLGVLQGDAAVSKARQILDGLTPYKVDDLTFDLGAKGVGGMAPVAALATSTLQEANDFAIENGFRVVQFTTKCDINEFPRQPRFYLTPPRRLSPVLKWAAAAVVVLGFGVGAYEFWPQSEPDTPTAQVSAVVVSEEPVAPAADPHEKPEAKLVLAKVQPITPVKPASLPEPDLPVVQVDPNTPLVTPVFAGKAPLVDAPFRLSSPLERRKAGITQASLDESFLQEAVARKPGYQPGATPAPVYLARTGDALGAAALALRQDTPGTTDLAGLQLVSRSSPLSTRTLSNLPSPSEVSGILLASISTFSVADQLEAEALARATLVTPTPQGAPNSDGILVFSGRPPGFGSWRDHVNPPVPVNPLAGFRSRARPAGLVVLQPSAPEAPLVPADTTSGQDPTLVSLADPALAGRQASTQPDNLITPEVAVEEVTPPEAEAPSLLALADPALAVKRARARPDNLVIPEVASEEVSPSEAEAPSLLALADPALAVKRARARPDNLVIPEVASEEVAPPEADAPSLLALADPALAGKRARARPRNLRVFALAAPKADASDTVPSGSIFAGATRLAVAISTRPRIKPANLSAVIKRLRATRPSGQVASLAPNAGPKVLNIPTITSVTEQATVKSKFSKSRMSLVGVYGTSSSRRALVRLPGGKYVKVKTGDKVSGWKISAIGETSLRIRKGSKDQVLRMPN